MEFWLWKDNYDDSVVSIGVRKSSHGLFGAIFHYYSFGQLAISSVHEIFGEKVADAVESSDEPICIKGTLDE